MPAGEWIGLKTIVYNLTNNTGVKLEAWVDFYGGDWTKILEYVDSGKWGTGGEICKGTKEQIITWGGPVAGFEWEQLDVDIKNLSIREIATPN